jgi:ribonucleoside-diphosphate reductase alpha chain
MSDAETRTGLQIQRHFTTAGKDPFDEITWTKRDVVIRSVKDEVVFEQKDVEAPDFWSDTAVSVVASKYFRGKLGTPEREHSVRQLIKRVVLAIGWRSMTACHNAGPSYFPEAEDLATFKDELTYLLVHQYASFNSPVWFNVGVENKPQCSACFINSVEDTMDSILELCKIEGNLFKYGSGSGTNFSRLRGSEESLSSGGKASGPVSFMRGYDAFAGVIQSGGKTRRAAKMAILDIDHPDIELFIECKAKEEHKAQALIEAGYDGGIDGEAYSSVAFQNANNSVRVSDEFMQMVINNGIWRTMERKTRGYADSYEAQYLMRQIARAAYACGDPGIQFDDTINRWHTCKKAGRINASNPCSEFMFLDDSACNLASLNLMKFQDPQGEFDVTPFKHAIDAMITAQDILINNASYPTERIERHSRQYRPLGLGYTNLGALLMANGMPYDSDEGREHAAAITALMTGEAYLQSARLAEIRGPFEGYEDNKNCMEEVIDKHCYRVKNLGHNSHVSEATAAWYNARNLGRKHGFRNAQVTALAPTGTISFMMDCTTTGIEPELSLVKHKKLVGGGTIKQTNDIVETALRTIGVDAAHRSDILKHIEKTGTIEGTDLLRDKDLPVFDCALRSANGKRCIEPMGHVRMMAAVQPFISGAISKTVNVPNDTTPENIADVFMQAWKMGLKSIAVYRDGCKVSQPLTVEEETVQEKTTEKTEMPQRRRLPDERQSLTHKFSIGGQEGYVTVGLYEDGTPGEVFITMSKEGSTISGLMDSLATSISIALQYGVPLDILVNKFSHMRFEPSGWTGNKEIPMAKSITDYLFRWLGLRFLKKVGGEEEAVEWPRWETLLPVKTTGDDKRNQEDAPSCATCGSIMTRNGSCYKCDNCGSTSGCS